MDLIQLDGLDMHSGASLREAGRARRERVPRSAHAEFRASGTRDPLGIIEEQNAGRLQELLGLRTQRMRQSAFAFYRGTAAIQAADLARETVSGARVVVNGDSHLSNFGFYRSPQRTLVFDMNDFDEATVAPWEWDVKRLVASVVVAARARGASRSDAESLAVETAGTYRAGIAEFSSMPAIERFYRRVDLDDGAQVPPSLEGVVRDARRASKRRTSSRVIDKVTEVEIG